MTENIGRLIKIASINLSRELDKYTKQFELTGSQMTILDFLARNQTKLVVQKDIEDEFYLKPSTVSVLLGRMEKKGFINREVSPVDKRQRYIKLTAKASDLTEIIQAYTMKDHQRMTEDLSEQELLILTRFLKKVGGISE
ncbi:MULTISPECIES: MarR family transcriptional regulator [unclassified Enterococcus]|uniref:MarR family winged helix-turn-helix transcriptional regulator n=1 Tax=unclassified Enterococcus TaxID=2608891 RepID=UPI001555A36B|nr:MULTISPECIES: MarR family transcriptional regulator [unclassified Enterococcus]MBS7577118.1 MarR family transcriptional regulator [Enterococcus sp. MMGLQ5-2]MBS7584435.1 MarR family transcriptional regulator [Enterococcus sp. MMGLQ5-1]NPD12290.1 MarR family transcriptional regulator [Enterococcus sp. MMGLQ5-1]NPD36952.1 MarR family transcriptional regulator [Enterococcus sp. MMGLQ5-2]